MKITKTKVNKVTVALDTIQVGNCFTFMDYLYIRTDARQSGSTIVCCELVCGHNAWFSPDLKVTPVDPEVML